MSEDAVAQDQIRSFVDRIVRLKEEAKAINADVREIYAEAKGNGFDKTVLGKLVNYVERRAEKPNEVAEGEALFDLYLTAYDSASDRVGMARATHTHEAPSHDPETGEFTEPQSSEAAAQAGRASLPLTTSPVESEDAEISTPHPVANVEEEADGAIAAVSDDAASREPDGADRQQPADSGFTGGREPGSGEPVAAAQDRAPLYLSPDAPFHDPNEIEDEGGARLVGSEAVA